MSRLVWSGATGGGWAALVGDDGRARAYGWNPPTLGLFSLWRGRVAAPLAGRSRVDLGEGRQALLAGPVRPPGSWVDCRITAEPEVAAVRAVDADPDQRKPKLAEAMAELALMGRFFVHMPAGAGVRLSGRLAGATKAALKAWVGGAGLGGSQIGGGQIGGGWVVRSAAAGADPALLRGEAVWLHEEGRAVLERSRAAPERMGCLRAAPAGWWHLLTQEDDEPPGLLAVAARAQALAWRHALTVPAPDLAALVAVEPQAAFAIEPAATDRLIPLPGGGALVIDRTEALTVIDVNGGGLAPAMIAETAAAAIARRLRLANSSGAIVIDPAGRGEAGRHLVETLRSCLATDPAEPHILGLSRLGLIEITRQRRRERLDEALARLSAP